MDIKIVGEVPNSGPIEMRSDAVIGGSPLEIEKKIVCDMYDIDEVEAKRSDSKINTLLEYVKAHSPDMSSDNIRWTLRELELKLGTPPISEKRINYMAQYAFLMSEKQQIEKEIKKFY